jgi:serine/threonine protein phosphatase PrpC
VESHDAEEQEVVATAEDTEVAKDSAPRDGLARVTAKLEAADAAGANASSASNGDHGVALELAAEIEEVEVAKDDTLPPAAQKQEGPVTFTPGALIGSYRIIRILRDVAGRRLALAMTPFDSGAPYLIAEAQPERVAAISALIELQLRHPRLVAPRELHSFSDARFVVAEGAMVAESALCGPMESGAVALQPDDALRAGAGLADALSYLHRNGLAHHHVAPDSILFSGGRAYLFGLEDAVMLEDNVSEAPNLVARDANMLAITLAQLARVTDGSSDSDAAARSLREAAARGAENAYTTPEEVAAICGSALQVPPQALPTPPAESIGVPLHLEAGTATSVGHVRSENQDAVVSMVLDAHDDAARGDAPIGIFLVADGMGGEAHGELASRIAARILPAQILSQLILPLYAKPALAFDQPISGENLLSIASVADMLDRGVTAANQHIRDMAQAFGQDTGSTLTVVVSAGPQAAIAHLGDSRMYLLREGKLIRLTEDHTLLARLEAMDHPILEDPTFYVPRNFLYRSLGQEHAPPDVRPFTLAPGDRFVICSDGLWDELDDEAIKSTLATVNDPELCAHRLVAMANEAGGHDNSTAVVVFARARAQDDGAWASDDTTEYPAIANPDATATPAANSVSS